MGPRSKKEYIEAVYLRYKHASHKGKTIILDEFCAICGYHRKHAIRLLRSFKRFTKPKSKRRRKTPIYQNDVITDISLGGLRISVPKDHTFEIHTDERTSDFDTLFALPNERRPVNVKCKPQSVFHANGDTQIGASFVDADFNSYQTIRDYLV
jgi:hypothetical protein